jgi:hypothetical protein
LLRSIRLRPRASLLAACRRSRRRGEDRLLKEAATAWRDQLRAGDLLARVGGEEFALMLVDCELDTATDVVERLRASMPRGRTCSAALAGAPGRESRVDHHARRSHALPGQGRPSRLPRAARRAEPATGENGPTDGLSHCLGINCALSA